MKFKISKTFYQLMKKFNVPDNFNVKVRLTKDELELLNDKIIYSELGITLKSMNFLYKAKDKNENQSTIEDFENHFHINIHSKSTKEKVAFYRGIKTIILLAEKFKKAGYKKIRFTFYFQDIELNRKFTKDHFPKDIKENFANCINERLSFHKRRRGEVIIPKELFNYPYGGYLIIDI